MAKNIKPTSLFTVGHDRAQALIPPIVSPLKKRVFCRGFLGETLHLTFSHSLIFTNTYHLGI